MTTNAPAPVPGSFTPIVDPAAAPSPAPTPAPAAPAPAPAQAPAPAPAPAAEPTTVPLDAETGDKKGTFEYAPTRHKGLDAALGFVGRHGYGPDHPAMQSAVSGDFSLLRAELAEKGVQGADAYIMLAESAFKELQAGDEAKRTADTAELHKIVGGAENWTAIQDWAKQNAEPDEAEAIKGMLAKGGAEMKIAASFLANGFQRATGGIPEGEGAGPAVSDVRGTPATNVGTLSPQEYGRAVEAARKAHRGREEFEDTQVYAQLRERRARFKG